VYTFHSHLVLRICPPPQNPSIGSVSKLVIYQFVVLCICKGENKCDCCAVLGIIDMTCISGSGTSPFCLASGVSLTFYGSRVHSRRATTYPRTALPGGRSTPKFKVQSSPFFVSFFFFWVVPFSSCYASGRGTYSVMWRPCEKKTKRED